MLVAIHNTPGRFSERWIQFCTERGIPMRFVDCYRSDIVEQLSGCNILMWHWNHGDRATKHFARQLTASLECAGLDVFPSVATSWHYDDKVGQKYLLEAVGAPLVPTHVFFDRSSALSWVEQTTFPKVFKLSGGAGSADVRLVQNAEAATRLVGAMFGRGISSRGYMQAFKDRGASVLRNRDATSIKSLLAGIGKVAKVPSKLLARSRDRGYAYFQDFISGNDHDIRVVVIGRRAFAIKRLVREGDFRASGSGKIVYAPNEVPLECVKIAFEITARLASQCAAYDFVFDGNRPLIVEVSYAFAQDAYRACPGYWDDTLNWHSEHVEPERFMIEDALGALR